MNSSEVPGLVVQRLGKPDHQKPFRAQGIAQVGDNLRFRLVVKIDEAVTAKHDIDTSHQFRVSDGRTDSRS